MNINRSLFFIFSLVFFKGCLSKEQIYQDDIFAIGGTTSGISTEIQSNILGISTLIIKETLQLGGGGVLKAQGVSTIVENHNLTSGIWNEFRNNLRTHYGLANSFAAGWVCNTWFESHIGSIIF